VLRYCPTYWVERHGYGIFTTYLVLFRSHGVEKIFKLDKQVACVSTNVVFLTRGDIITVKKVCDQVNSSIIGGLNHKWHLVIIPFLFHAAETLVEEEGLFSKIKLHSFHWELISIDPRIFSFETPDVFKFMFVAKDPTYVVPCSKLLWALQHICGQVNFKMFIGANSKAVGNMVSNLDQNIGEPDCVDNELGLLLVIDRDIDYASVMLTPGTYSGLVAEVVGIDTGVVQVPKQDDKPATTMVLNSDDETYNQIQHKHFSDVVPFLKQRISEVSSAHERRKNMTIQQMKDYVKNDLNKAAQYGKILSNHLHICEKVSDTLGALFEGIQQCQHDILTGASRKESLVYIQNLIATGGDMNLALRLLCLLSICQNGLTQDEAAEIKSLLLHAYGHQHLLTWFTLEKMGLLNVISDPAGKFATKMVQAVAMPRRSGFQSVVAKMKLFPEASDDYSVKTPKDPGYVFGGIYIPVMVQLVNLLLKKEKSIGEITRGLPGDGADVVVQGKGLDNVADIHPRTIWVHVLGGITYAEIAGFSWLEKKTGCRIICSGSLIINGNSLMQSVIGR